MEVGKTPPFVRAEIWPSDLSPQLSQSGSAFECVKANGRLETCMACSTNLSPKFVDNENKPIL